MKCEICGRDEVVAIWDPMGDLMVHELLTLEDPTSDDAICVCGICGEVIKKISEERRDLFRKALMGVVAVVNKEIGI